MRTLLVCLSLILSININYAQNLKPYILGVETTESIADIKTKLHSNLVANNIEIVGEYQPANDKNRWIVIFTSNELEAAVQKVGGITCFAATLRIGITKENGKTLVSYTNPIYWGNAYFREDYSKVSSLYNSLNKNMVNTMNALGEFKNTPFGSEEGINASDLHKYHYMMGMPYFDDTIELEDFESHKAAIDKIDASIKKGVPNVKQVYKVNIPNEELTLYGFALSGDDGESNFMPIIDISSPKHTAFLPYEVLVIGKEVHILHGRYRIALSFPDLTMSTFTKIMSTPGDIEDLLEQLVK